MMTKYGRSLTPDEQQRFASLLAALSRLPKDIFAHMRLATERGIQDVFLGAHTQINDAVPTLHWQRAPLAAVFFAYLPGDEYEVESDGRMLTGTMLERHILRFAEGALIEVMAPEMLFRRTGNETWRAYEIDENARVRLQARPATTRRHSFHVLPQDLDPTQQRAVNLARDFSMLILGDAGYGKTTVAFHRLLHLYSLAREQKASFSALVIVPTIGLTRLYKVALAQRGIENIPVLTFEQWIEAQARNVFAKLPRRISQDVSPTIRQLKRHPALLEVGIPKVAMGTSAMKSLKESHPLQPARRGDLLHLFGDQELLEQVLQAAGGELPRTSIHATIEHTKVQFSVISEQRFAYVDAARLQTLDGKSLDAGTPMENAESIDVEDFAVLFALTHLRTGCDQGPKGKLTHYDHIVLDEAQEFAPIELAVVGRSIREHGTITIAGDEKQQIDPTHVFRGWQATIKDLGARKYQHISLERSYRCPPAIEAFARSLFMAPEQELRLAADPALLLSSYDHMFHQCAALIETIVDLQIRDANVSIAVIARNFAIAQAIYTTLSQGLNITWVGSSEDVRFAPGVQITAIEAVRGLEFDIVILPEVTPAFYPATDEARRLLYVAATRATHQLWLTTSGCWSPLIPSSLLRANSLANMP